MTCRKCLETSEYWQILVSLPWQIFQGRLTEICQYYTKKPTKLSAGLHSVSLDRKKCGLAFWVYLTFSRLRLTLLDPFGVLQGQIQPLEGQINSKSLAPLFSGREKTLVRPAKNHYLPSIPNKQLETRSWIISETGILLKVISQSYTILLKYFITHTSFTLYS